MQFWSFAAHVLTPRAAPQSIPRILAWRLKKGRVGNPARHRSATGGPTSQALYSARCGELSPTAALGCSVFNFFCDVRQHSDRIKRSMISWIWPNPKTKVTLNTGSCSHSDNESSSRWYPSLWLACGRHTCTLRGSHYIHRAAQEVPTRRSAGRGRRAFQSAGRAHGRQTGVRLAL